VSEVPSAGGRSDAAAGPYAGRVAVLATMHAKHEAIAGPLAERLGLRVTVPADLDTDRLGTFTGEVPRAGTIEETAVAKARLGMAAAGVPLGLASEGSFGPHPAVPFVAAGIELLVLVDDERGIVLREQDLDERPCYHHAVAADADGLEDFLERAAFPGHALIVRPNEPREPGEGIFKGIREHDALAAAVAEAARRSADARAFVQNDMRAHMNPTRMASLERLAHRFAERAASLCPACAAPGYGAVGVEEGLPCAWCGGPTHLVRHRILGCVACDRVEQVAREDGLAEADAGNCPRCNP
jgi:hypothetical protein